MTIFYVLKLPLILYFVVSTFFLVQLLFVCNLCVVVFFFLSKSTHTHTPYREESSIINVGIYAMPIVAPPAGNDVVFLKLKLKSINLMYTLHLWVDVVV